MKEIKACPRCGSCKLTIPPESIRDIRSIQSGVYYCRGCEWTGIPLLFEDREQYEEFLESRS